MEDLVESYLKQCTNNIEYFKELKTKDMEKILNIGMSKITNNGKTIKRFDFVVKAKNMIYGIETNFYAGGGSKLNETARSYETIANESRKINGFGWQSAKNNLEKTLNTMEHIYNINDMENGIMNKIFV